MNTETISTAAVWTGRVLKIMLCIFLLFDCSMKIIKHSKSIEGTKQFGLPENCVQFLGFYLLAATVLYIIPKTPFHGILLLIAYLGGAAAITYLNKPTTFGFLFPIVFAVLIVVAEYLQNINLRNIIIYKQ